MTSSAILAIDPGISTGVAIKTARGEYLMLVVTEPVKLWDIIEAHKPGTIVVENFASGGLISRDGQATIRLVGAMELAAYITGASLVLQSPQERYPQMDNARAMLKQRGKTPISHEVDSLSHLLLYEHRLANGLKIKRRTFETTTI